MKFMDTDIEPSPQLELAPEQPGEPGMKQLAPFDALRTQAEKLKLTAETLTVTSIDDKAGMKLARSTRLALKEVRVAITHRHSELKEHINEEGRLLDRKKRELFALIEPLEARMLECEEFAEREAVRIAEAKCAARIAELEPFTKSPPWHLTIPNLGKLSDEDYAGLLASCKLTHESVSAAEAARIANDARIAREAQLRAERHLILAPLAQFMATRCADPDLLDDDVFSVLLKEGRDGKAADDAAREAQRLENERLAKLAKEQAEALAGQQAHAQAEAVRVAKLAEDERKAAKALADAALAEAEAEAAKERKKAKEAADELSRQQAEAAKKLADAARDARQAAAAPDKEKLASLAAALRAVPIPKLSLAVATLEAEIKAGIEHVAAWLESKAEAL